MEALDLAVGARSVGLRASVLDPFAVEQLVQRAVLDVAEGVVVISRLALIPCASKNPSARSVNAVTVAAFSSVSSST